MPKSVPRRPWWPWWPSLLPERNCVPRPWSRPPSPLRTPSRRDPLPLPLPASVPRSPCCTLCRAPSGPTVLPIGENAAAGAKPMPMASADAATVAIRRYRIGYTPGSRLWASPEARVTKSGWPEAPVLGDCGPWRGQDAGAVFRGWATASHVVDQPGRPGGPLATQAHTSTPWARLGEYPRWRPPAGARPYAAEATTCRHVMNSVVRLRI